VAACLADQLERARVVLAARLDGLTDEEFFWEPVPGCWTIHPRDGSAGEWTGAGEWIYDYVLPDPEPPPVTTIGWRLVHIGSINDMFFEHVFGPAQRDYPDQTIPHDATGAVAWWEEGIQRFLETLDRIEDSDLDKIVAVPWEVSHSVATWVEMVVYENVHHGAEIGVLRDLYREKFA
jgi:DinB superfamily